MRSSLLRTPVVLLYALCSSAAFQCESNLRLDFATLKQPNPPLPPFPNGPCAGTTVTLPVSKTYGPGGHILLPSRSISVWLPPEYFASSDATFDVLYCHDGQNAIQDTSSWTGSSWRLVGALTRLSQRGLFKNGLPPIVVLIPSASGDILPGIRRRHLEYGDLANSFSAAHADFVAATLKPLVDRMFRTRKGPEGTYAIGASLGGQAALNLILRHSNIFGGAACMSPCFQPATIAAVAFCKKDILQEKVLYLDNGGDVDDKKVSWFDILDHITPEHWWNPGYFWLDTQLQPTIDMMRFVLDTRGVKYAYHRAGGARHNERAWAQRIHKPLLALFGPP